MSDTLNDEWEVPILGADSPSTMAASPATPPAQSASDLAQQNRARIVSGGLRPEELFTDQDREREERSERFHEQMRDKAERDARILKTLEEEPPEITLDVGERIALALERIANALELGGGGQFG